VEGRDAVCIVRLSMHRLHSLPGLHMHLPLARRLGGRAAGSLLGMKRWLRGRDLDGREREKNAAGGHSIFPLGYGRAVAEM
jgi:hypothetical protein